MTDEKDPEKLDVIPGNLVAVRDDALKVKALTPVGLMELGWPNQFLVREVFDDAQKGQLLRLDPCCVWMVDWKQDDYPFKCLAHPAKYFQKLEGKFVEPPKGERYVGAAVGEHEFIAIEPVANGKSVKAVVQLPGLPPVSLDGTAVKNLIKKLGGNV